MGEGGLEEVRRFFRSRGALSSVRRESRIFGAMSERI